MSEDLAVKTINLSESDMVMLPEKIDFKKELENLYGQLFDLVRRKGVADHFSVTAQSKIDDIKEQIDVVRSFLDAEEINSIKQLEDRFNDQVMRLDMRVRKGDTVRRGALTAKEKEAQAKEYEKEKEKRKEENDRPNDKSRPNQPKQPPKAGEAEKPEQLLPPQERQAAITEKLKQKDPRKQKEGLEELKKPQNKDLGKDDPTFQKLVKNADKRVERFDKVKDSLRKNLKTLMQSDSDVIKKNLADIRAGRIGSGVMGLKEVSNSTDGRFNEVAKAAKGVVENVGELYKEFDIKPEEALSREALNEAKPTFTRQTGIKSKEDMAIDRNSRQNRYMGESKELSVEERHVYKRIKDNFGMEADKLPAADAQTVRDMELVRNIVKEVALNPQGNVKPTMIKPSGVER